MTLGDMIGRIRGAIAGGSAEDRARRFHAERGKHLRLSPEERERTMRQRLSGPEAERAIRELEEMQRQRPGQ